MSETHKNSSEHNKKTRIIVISESDDDDPNWYCLNCGNVESVSVQRMTINYVLLLYTE